MTNYIFIAAALLLCVCQYEVVAQVESVSSFLVDESSTPAHTISSVDWAHLTAATLAEVAPNEFASLTAEQLSSIPSDACGGWTLAQMQSTGVPADNTVCSGFTSACVANLPWQAFGGLTQFCLHAMESSIVGSFSNVQISSITGDACPGFTQNQTAALSADQCNHLGMDCFQQYSTDGASGFTRECIAGLSDSVIAAFPTANINALNLDAVVGITSSNNDLMTTNCGGFRAEQFAVMQTSAWSGWSNECSAHFLPSSLAGWTRAQMRSYASAKFWKWTVEQVRGLSPLGASGISPRAAKGIPAKLCAGFHREQIAFFRDFYVTHVCYSWNSDCLAEISAEEYVGFSQECFQKIRPTEIPTLTDHQLGSLAPTTFYILTAPQISALSPSSCKGITPSQMSMLDFAAPSQQCAYLTTDCLAQLEADTVASMNPQCIAHVKNIDQLSDSFFYSLTTLQLSYFQADQCSQLSNDRLATLLKLQVRLSASCMSGFQPSQCGNFTADDLGVLESSSVSSLSTSCISAIQPSTCAQLSVKFWNGFQNATAALQSFSHECVSKINCDALLNLDSTVVNGLNLTQIELDKLVMDCKSSGAGSDGSEPTGVRTVLIIISLAVFGGGLVLAAFFALRVRRRKIQTNEQFDAAFQRLERS